MALKLLQDLVQSMAKYGIFTSITGAVYHLNTATKCMVSHPKWRYDVTILAWRFVQHFSLPCREGIFESILQRSFVLATEWWQFPPLPLLLRKRCPDYMCIGFCLGEKFGEQAISAQCNICTVVLPLMASPNPCTVYKNT